MLNEAPNATNKQKYFKIQYAMLNILVDTD